MRVSAKGICFLIVIVASLSGLACDSSSTDEAAESIQRYVCYDTYWRSNNEYRTDLKVKMVINRSQNNKYVWIDGLESLSASSETATFISLKEEPNVGWDVAEWVVFNKRIMGDSQNFLDHRNKVFNGQQEVGYLTLKNDCSPVFDGDSSIKQDVLKVIENTVSHELAQLRKAGIKKFKPMTKIIVANYNLYYPETFVLIPDTNDIFVIRLHDAEYSTADYLRQNEFPIGFNENSTDDLKNKIIRNGIQQTIDTQ